MYVCLFWYFCHIGISCSNYSSSVPVQVSELILTIREKSVFKDVDSLRQFLCTHPDSIKYFKNGVTVDPKFKLQRVTHVVAAVRFLQEYGMYPSQDKKAKLAEMLGDLFDQPPCVFFDRNTNEGCLRNSIATLRRKPSIQISDFDDVDDHTISCG